MYWSECPSHEQAWDRLQEVLADEGIEAEIERIEVRTDEEAMRRDFHGSPTIRVDGTDVDAAGVTGMPVALACRVYRLEDGRFSPLPSKEMIRRAVSG